MSHNQGEVGALCGVCVCVGGGGGGGVGGGGGGGGGGSVCACIGVVGVPFFQCLTLNNSPEQNKYIFSILSCPFCPIVCQFLGVRR